MSPQHPWTVLRLIQWTKEYFSRTRVDEPRLSAEILLGHVLGVQRVGLYARFDQVVGEADRAAYRNLVQQAAAGKPIAYLTGSKEFYSLDFRVTPDVLIPRPETELLVDAVLDFARTVGGPVRLWDVCTGSGCVAVAAATYGPMLSALATDISEPALTVARDNVARHGLAGRVRVVRTDLLDLPDEAAAMAPFDAIAANPPYVADADMASLPAPVRHEPPAALRAGADGMAFIGRIVPAAADHLRPGGLLAMEIGYAQAEGVYDLLNAAGPYESVGFLKDAAGIERTAVARRRGGQ